METSSPLLLGGVVRSKPQDIRRVAEAYSNHVCRLNLHKQYDRNKAAALDDVDALRMDEAEC